jgi:hypothetical protein
MQGHEINVYSTNLCRSPRKLPPILLLQMDNCVSGNKNIHVFIFISFNIKEVV